MRPIRTDQVALGPGLPCFVVAEAGVNHNGSVALAHDLISAAKHCGANAVKFQTFAPERLVTRSAAKATYQGVGAGGAQTQFAMLEGLQLSRHEHGQLAAHCQDEGILFLSTPFDEESADLLEEIGVPLFKVGSGDLTHLPLLRYLARKGRPLIVSTGMATLAEVEQAVQTVEEAGTPGLALLHCVSDYPADPSEANLRAMKTMELAFGYPVGYSDHTPGAEVACAAVALGACVLEKHLTLSRELPGPDQAASLEPVEFQAMVTAIRTVESALGSGSKRRTAGEEETAAVARRSLVLARDCPAGGALTPEMIVVLRPGTGLPPGKLESVLGRHLRVALPAGTLLTWDALC